MKPLTLVKRRVFVRGRLYRETQEMRHVMTTPDNLQLIETLGRAYRVVDGVYEQRIKRIAVLPAYDLMVKIQLERDSQCENENCPDCSSSNTSRA